MEVSASILSVKKENCIQNLYNLEKSGIKYFNSIHKAEKDFYQLP